MQAMLIRMRLLVTHRREQLDAADAAAEAGDHGTEDEQRRFAGCRDDEIADCVEALDEWLNRLLAFAQQVADLTKDGELVDDTEFVMENHDAVDILNNLISEARALLEESGM